MLRKNALFWGIIMSSSLNPPSAFGALAPVGVEGFFVTPDQPSVLRFKLAPAADAKELAYVITGYWDKPVVESKAAVGEGGAVEVQVKLAPGYYQVSFPDANASFGVVALRERKGENDPFFCIDSAMTWLVKDGVLRESLVKGLRRAGIDMSRERVSWGGLHREREKFEWDAAGAETLRRTYTRIGVKMLEMFHDTPPWMGAAKANPYPRDLPAAAESWAQIAKRWSPHWGALEIWNEPDIFFGGEAPADQYVPLVKAIACALREADVKTPLVGGVFTDGAPGSFLQSCAANGLLDCVDAVSFHNYRPATSIEGLVAAHRAWVRACGKESMPLWITECGRPWSRGPQRPPTKEDAASALEITMQAVESRACGVARHFAFVYPYYEENVKNFGMMGKEGTPLRCMAAYACCAAALSDLRYLGDLPVDDAAVKRARAFGDDRQAVVVLFTGQARPDAAVKVKVAAQRIEGIDGRPLSGGPDGTIPIPDGLTYVWTDREKLAGLLKTDTPAAALYAAARKAPPQRPEASAIVLQYLPDPEKVRASKQGYTPVGQDATKFSMKVRLSNLSRENRKVRLAITHPNGIGGTDGMATSTASQSELPQIDVPARGLAEAEVAVDLTKFLDKRAQARITVLAQADAGPRVSPLTITVQPELGLEDMLRMFPVKKALPIGELKRWTRNIVGDGQMTMSVTKDGHWRLEAKFAKSDPWVYPFFALRKEDELPRASGLVVRIRCENPAAVRVMLHKTGGPSSMTGHSIIEADGKWHAALIPFADLTPAIAHDLFDQKGNLDLSPFDTIQIGLNSRAQDKQNVLEVSDTYVVGE